MASNKEFRKAWDRAMRLSDAWYFFATKRQQDLYKKLHIASHGRVGRQYEMQEQLRFAISRGRVPAYGIPSGVEAKSGAERIQPHFFERSAEIDWMRSKVSNYGNSYEEVRVPETEMLASKEDAPESYRPGDMLAEAESSGKADRPRMGRPSIDAELDDVIQSLINEEAFAGKLGKEMEAAVRSRARQKYPGKFPKITQPSHAKILQALGRVGLSESRGPKSLKSPLKA